MGTMNIALPHTLRVFFEQQVAHGGYGTSSEYVRELIRRHQDRWTLRALLIVGAHTPVFGEADGVSFSALRSKVSSRARVSKYL